MVGIGPGKLRVQQQVAESVALSFMWNGQN